MMKQQAFPSLFDRALGVSWLLFLVPLLFIPKINLISFAGHTSGIRVDDVLLFAFTGFAVMVHYYFRLPLLRVERWLIFFGVSGLVSLAVNQLLYPEGMKEFVLGVFYSVRLFEYFAFFYLGIMAYQWLNFSLLMAGFIVVAYVMILLQAFHIVGSFTVYAGPGVTGMASFDSEMGALLNIVFCYATLNTSDVKKIWRVLPGVSVWVPQFLQKGMAVCKRVLFFSGAVVCQTLVNHRTSLASLFLLIGARAISASRAVRITTVVLLIGLTISIFTVAGQDSYLFQRSKKLFNKGNVALIGKAWDRVDLDFQPTVQGEVHLPVDMSWWMRLHKWCYAIKHFLHKPLAPFIGVGPGFLGPALDGGALRLLVEYGLLGSCCFVGMLSCLWYTRPHMPWVIVAFLLNMLLFDAYLAYKFMSVFFFIAGAAFWENRTALSKSFIEKQ